MGIGRPSAGFKFQILNTEFSGLLTGLVSPFELPGRHPHQSPDC